jgi:hypothetical protein
MANTTPIAHTTQTIVIGTGRPVGTMLGALSDVILSPTADVILIVVSTFVRPAEFLLASGRRGAPR